MTFPVPHWWREHSGPLTSLSKGGQAQGNRRRDQGTQSHGEGLAGYLGLTHQDQAHALLLTLCPMDIFQRFSETLLWEPAESWPQLSWWCQCLSSCTPPQICLVRSLHLELFKMTPAWVLSKDQCLVPRNQTSVPHRLWTCRSFRHSLPPPFVLPRACAAPPQPLAFV